MKTRFVNDHLHEINEIESDLLGPIWLDLENMGSRYVNAHLQRIVQESCSNHTGIVFMFCSNRAHVCWSRAGIVLQSCMNRVHVVLEACWNRVHVVLKPCWHRI